MFRDLERSRPCLPESPGVTTGVNLAYKGQTSDGEGMLVSDYFPELQLVPAAGRLFSPTDDQAPGANPLTVLSYGYWTSRFARNPSIVGSQILVNGVSCTVIGVAPEGFSGTSLGAMPDVFVPLSMREAIQQGWKGFDERRSYWVYLFARLKPGISREQAQAGINPIFHGHYSRGRFAVAEGNSDRYRQQFVAQVMTLQPGARGRARC